MRFGLQPKDSGPSNRSTIRRDHEFGESLVDWKTKIQKSTIACSHRGLRGPHCNTDGMLKAIKSEPDVSTWYFVPKHLRQDKLHSSWSRLPFLSCRHRVARWLHNYSVFREVGLCIFAQNARVCNSWVTTHTAVPDLYATRGPEMWKKRNLWLKSHRRHGHM
jgi:hypothetical protein